MAVLKPSDFGGPLRGFANCGCGSPSIPSITQGTAVYVPTVESCGAADGQDLPGNVPVTDAEYQCSFGVTFQPVLDASRRIVHAAGLRPYRVFLVWQERLRNRTLREVHRCELTPVRVMHAEGIELTTAVWGEDIVGGYTLEEVSPAQVDEDTLHGYLNGEDWAAKSTEREFFYEVVLHQRCPGAPITPRRRRFVIGGEPYLNGQRFYWRVEIVEQKVARSRSGVDQTIGTEFEDTQSLPFNRPTLVT